MENRVIETRAFRIHDNWVQSGRSTTEPIPQFVMAIVVKLHYNTNSNKTAGSPSDQLILYGF